MMNKPTSLVAALFVKVVLLGFAGILSAENGPEKNAEPIATFQIPKNGDTIVLPITLANKEYLFMLDTGFSLNVIDKSLKNELGKYQSTEKVFTPNNPVGMESYGSPPLYLGNVLLQTYGKVLCSDLKVVRQALGREVFGILGMDSLKHLIIQIDFDNGQAKFFSPNAKADREWGEPLAMSYNEGDCPEINGFIHGDPCTFTIDTGDSGINLENGLFQRL